MGFGTLFVCKSVQEAYRRAFSQHMSVLEIVIVGYCGDLLVLIRGFCNWNVHQVSVNGLVSCPLKFCLDFIVLSRLFSSCFKKVKNRKSIRL